MAACLTLIMVLAGCAAMQLDTFKKHAANGDHGWIAAQAVTCEKASDVCGQLHLIKGDACFRLARADTVPAANYACAADELEKGLALTRSWADAAVHRQFQENLCESLKNLQDLQSGEVAAQTLARFVEAAEGLYKLAPESVPAVYYLAKARLRQVQPLLSDINAASRVPVCNRLKRTVTNVLSMMETAKEAPLPDWDRFANNYQRLSFDLGSAIRAADCR
ncbi:MAG: hypothetical protein HGJ94_14965 [Desulfosarcina sp.]|nr:hypothetical protein [Desulfosarcina sp.]MBC2741851.1 hypothetical protein [Desulfosarcina sp.]MBC2764764.1 hypothetical protein [Desulfosarcina sp.]